MTESFLQYVWQHRLLDGPLTTTEGQPVIVERPGALNRDSGPDFFDARISIGGVLWAGNVEVHIKASDWNQHGHSSDKAYNNVILHVVYVHDADIVLENGKTVPTVAIADAIPENVWEAYDQLMNPVDNIDIPCAPRLKEIPDFLFHLSQDRLMVERMERKSDDVQRILKLTKGGWEQTCYMLVAHYFGGKANAFPFELLAKVTPMTVVAKIKDNPFRVESLYFGQAGLLEGELNDDYPKAMQREYNFLRNAYNLDSLPGHLWKFFRIRPPGFPTLRISQFAALMTSSTNLFSRMLDAPDVPSLRQLFEITASDYWNTHYNFDKPSLESPKSLGKRVVDNILINAWVPLLFKYGTMHGDENLTERAFTLLHNLPSEDNRIVRLWTSEKVIPQNAAESQALIQRYNEYCSQHRCLDCQLAFRLLSDKKS